MDIIGQLSLFFNPYTSQVKEPKPLKSQVLVDGITIDIVRKKIKNLNITVYARNGRVQVSSPMRASDKSIRDFVLTKIEWVKKHRGKFAESEYAEPLKYKTGEKHYYNAVAYPLSVISLTGRKPFVRINEGVMELYVKPRSTFKQREKVMREWYRAELKKALPPLMLKWESRIGVKSESFGIKYMTSRWGTCNITDKRIWINLELAKRSTACLEYIIVHELTHLLEASHNKRFKSLMDKHMPDWRVYSNLLKGK